jgi:hypothetical protein
MNYSSLIIVVNYDIPIGVDDKTLMLSLSLLVLLLVSAASGTAKSISTSTQLSRSNGSWNFNAVGGADSTGTHNSIAIDAASDQVRVSYFDETTRQLNYAFYAGEGYGNCGTNYGWSCGVVDSTVGRGLANSIAINPETHNPAIAYYGSDEKALYFTQYGCTAFGACAWGTPTVIDNSHDTDGDYVSLQFRPISFGGKPAIAYHAADPSHVYAGLVRYAEYIGAGGNCGGASLKWDCQTVEASYTQESLGWYVSLGFSSTNTASISYSSPKISQYVATQIPSLGNCGVTYPGTWKCEAVDFNPDPPVAAGTTTERRFSSLAVGPGEVRQIAYAAYNPYTTDYTLMYATSDVTPGSGNCGEHNFTCIEIDNIGGFASSDSQPLAIALDANGSPEIAYKNQTDVYLAQPAPGLVNGNCARSSGGISVNMWTCRKLPTPGNELIPNIVGSYLSLAVRATGLPIVAYSHYIDMSPHYYLNVARMVVPIVYFPAMTK